MNHLPFALQLYTVRDPMEKDVAKTLEAVKAAGYDFVELAGTGGLSPMEFRRLLDGCGLIAVSAHVGLQDLVQNVELVTDVAQTIGYKYLVFSWNAPDAQGWLDAAQQADEAGEALRLAGLQLCYHNHAHEFAPLDGKCVLDAIMDNTAPENLAAELDVYWVRDAGLDPVGQIRKYGDRCPLLHIKDMTVAEPHTFTEVGRGAIDMPAVFQVGREIGVEWYIVEQDLSAGDPLESARISAQYMRRQAL